MTNEQKPESLNDMDFLKKYLAGSSMDASSFKPDLVEAIGPGCVHDFIDERLITIEQLVSLHATTPWVIDALRSFNFIDAVKERLITIKEMSGLTES